MKNEASTAESNSDSATLHSRYGADHGDIKPASVLPDRSESVRLAQLSLLYGNLRAPLWTSLGVGVAFVLGMWPAVDQRVAIAWLVLHSLILVIRLGSLRAFHKKTPTIDRVGLWERRLVFGALATGIMWGGAAAFLFPPQAPLHQVLVGLTIGGMAAGGAVILSISLPAVLASIVPALAPLSLQFWLLDSRVGWILSFLTLVFAFILIRNSQNSGGALQRNQYLQLEIAEREQNLVKSTAELAAVFDHVGQFLVLLHPDGRIIRCNKIALEWADGSTKLEDVPFWEGSWWGEVEREAVREEIQTLDKHIGVRQERKIALSGGCDRILDYHLSPVLSPEGEVILLVVSGSDISERIRAEKTIEASEKKFRNLVEDSLAGVYIIDKGRFTYVNPTLAELFGYTPEEIVSEKSVADLVYEPDRKTVMKNLRARITGEVESMRYQFRGQHKNGEVLHVEVLGTRTEMDNHQVVIGTLLDITDHTVSRERIEQLANYDELTKLSNRRFLHEHAEKLTKNANYLNEPLAVLYLDLDHFKHVNDTLGHDVGDKLLIDVAGRLKACLRSSDLLARLGGDEFAFVLPGASLEIAEKVAQRVVRTVGEPFHVAGHTVRVGGSVGIAWLTEEREDANTLFKRADIAMYQAKRERGSYAFYRHGQELEATRRFTMETELANAIDRGELYLAYQPRIDLETGYCDSVEALVRWEHPERGSIPPGEFIAMAEESGLIVKMGAWVLEESLAQLRRWRDQGIDMRLAVNLSLRELHDADLLRRVKQGLEKNHHASGLLELEVTESAAMTDPEENVKTLCDLRELGVEIAIDDFGTGYSSLNYLKQLPADYLKVDRSFVSGVGEEGEQSTVDEGIIKVIMALAESLGIQVIAEGVETEVQLNFLRENGCRYAQGFYFAKPLAAEELAELMAVSSRFPVVSSS